MASSSLTLRRPSPPPPPPTLRQQPMQANPCTGSLGWAPPSSSSSRSWPASSWCAFNQSGPCLSPGCRACRPVSLRDQVTDGLTDPPTNRSTDRSIDPSPIPLYKPKQGPDKIVDLARGVGKAAGELKAVPQVRLCLCVRVLVALDRRPGTRESGRGGD